MSYVTYTTKALVCGSFERSAADKSFLLFTRDAGMLYAVAKSVREERSKQRNALQDFSRIRVSLVKGRQDWRIGSVEVLQNDFSVAKNKESRGSVAIVYRLLRRFIRGEEAVPELYDFVVEAIDELVKEQPNRHFLELFVQMRILATLGYVDEKTVPSTLNDLTLSDVAKKDNKEFTTVLEKILEKASDSSHL